MVLKQLDIYMQKKNLDTDLISFIKIKSKLIADLKLHN